jgi:hypothetical protein
VSLNYYARLASRYRFEEVRGSGLSSLAGGSSGGSIIPFGGNSLVVQEPIGVVAAFTAYNFALACFGQKSAPALVAVLWLASDQARHVTGIVLPIDAGQLANIAGRRVRARPGPDPSGSPVTAGFAPCDGPVVNLIWAVEDPHGASRRVQFGQHEVL